MKFAGGAFRVVLAALLGAAPASAGMTAVVAPSAGGVRVVSAIPAAVVSPASSRLPAFSPSAAASVPFEAHTAGKTAVFTAPTPVVSGSVRVDPSVALPAAAVQRRDLLDRVSPSAVLAHESGAAPDLKAAPGDLKTAAPTLGAMRDMPAAISGRAFDGAASGSEEAVEPEDLPTESAEAAPQMTELFVNRESKAGIKKGVLTAHVGLIKSKGSEWYWGKFKRGEKIALKSGTMTMFVTEVEGAKTIQIGSMQRKDFEGLFTPQRMAGKTLRQLQLALIQDLKDRQARRPGAPTPVAMSSQVRLVRFMSSVKARELPENRDESAYPIAPRTTVQLPEALQGLNHTLPKVVYLDMRLFPDGIPYPLIEDMSKLMKTGVYFVLLSEKPNEGAGSVEDLLTRKLTVKQRDQISRYKMVILSDDGNSLSGYSGNFSKPLPSVRFTQAQLEIMAFLASNHARGATVTAKSTRLDVVLPKGADGEATKKALFDGMKGMRLQPEQWRWTETFDGAGRKVLTVRPQSLAAAIPHLMEVMRDHEGVFVNNSDIMVVTRDPEILAATKGSIQPSAHLASDGVQLADEALASLLGPYRVNLPGDLAASASKIQSFLQGRSGSGFDGGNVYMMTGHVMHSAFNWAIWRYRNTGVLPTAEETVEIARGIWEQEVTKGSAKNLLGRPGESLAGFYETVEQRLRAMHQIAADVLKVYPIAVGTELPNLYVSERWKKGGVADHRDIFRLIFDFVVARETKDGKIEIVIVDFKTGQVPTLQNLEKDTQVQLYDLLVRRMWKTLRVPYGATGEKREVSDYKLNFLYTAASYQPSLNDWSRLKFDKFLKNVMNRIRRASAPPAPKADNAKKGPAKSPNAKKN